MTTPSAMLKPAEAKTSAAVPVTAAAGIGILAGLDATGAAGVVADLAAIHACYGAAPCPDIMTLITALTVQSDQAVREVVPTAPALLEAQLTQALQQRSLAVLKVGMLATEAQWLWLTALLRRWSGPDATTDAARVKTAYSRLAPWTGSALERSSIATDSVPAEPRHTATPPLQAPKPWVILDPVIFASSGGQLAQVEPAMVRQLLPYIDLLTPNLPELAWLCRDLLPPHAAAPESNAVAPNSNALVPNRNAVALDSQDPLFQQQLHALHQAGAAAIYVKGGHAQSDGYIDDVLSLAHSSQTQGACTQWRFRSLAVLNPAQNDETFTKASAEPSTESSIETGIASSSDKKTTRFDMRGTGCRLASAMAAYLHQGYDLLDALTLARAYLQQQLLHAVRPASAALPPAVTANLTAALLPDVTPLVSASPLVNTSALAKPAALVNPSKLSTASLHAQPYLQLQAALANPSAQGSRSALAAGFAAMRAPIGLYAVVDSVAWLAKLLPLGIPTIQLRIKDADADACRRAIFAAVALSRDYPSQLFINDHWQLAIEAGAYGVHLGQEDLADADVAAIAAAGLRLGISTHGYAEISRVLLLRPSYIALGHIFPTTTKQMPSAPQGLERLAAYVKLCQPIPTVAIGGIDLHNIDAVLATGVEGVAVVRAITTAADPLAATQQLMQHVALARGTEEADDAH